jgi:hypothetical protein
MAPDKENPEKNKQPDTPPKVYEVTAQGSLGLLAMGAAGIRAWRKKREEEKSELKNDGKND